MDEEKPISHVRECPCLYDKTHPDFKNTELKRRAWMRVANKLDISETVAMKRWGNLRERFSKEIRCTGNSSGSGAFLRKKWALLDSLDFLRGHIIPRPMTQSAPLSESCPANGELLDVFDETPSSAPLSSGQLISVTPAELNSIPLVQSTPSTSCARKRRAAQVDELDAGIIEAVKTFSEVCARKARREELSEEIRGFGTMICSAISRMKNSNQALVMRRCTDIVMEVQMQEEEEA